MIQNNDDLKSVTVLGDGSWGTTMAIHLAEQGHRVQIWSPFAAQVREMAAARENKRFLSGYPFPETLDPIEDVNSGVEIADIVICAIPTQFIRESMKRLTADFSPQTGIVSLSKGIENGTLLPSTQVIADSTEFKKIGGLWGPSHAEEVAKKLPTTLVSTSKDMEFAAEVQKLVSADHLRVYVNDDIVGVELGGALKNVIAIAAGILEGLEYGDNAKSALITRGLAEMARLGVALGAKPVTFMGLAGVGDLVTTCVSPFGRNRSVGLRIGRGESLDAILKDMTMVAEGVSTCRSVYALAQREGIEMPISDSVYDVLFNGASPKEATLRLMRRELKNEMYGFKKL